MRKKDLIKALSGFDDNDHLMIGEDAIPYVPKIEAICGKSEIYTAHYCVREVGHTGDCYSSCKQVDFRPD